MGRAPCCDKANVKKGPWSPEEDAKLKEYIEKHGTGGNWISLPLKAGLRRCGKSCRLRWLNYLRPNLKHGEFSDDEDRIICSLFSSIGSRWSVIAAQLPGRTDNDIKNYWNTKLKKKLMGTITSLQKRPHHQATSSQPSPSSTSLLLDQTPSSSYRCSNTTYYAPASANTTSFTGYDHLQPISFPSMGPLPHYPVIKDRFLVFGGDQASCSSSDVEYEYGVCDGDQPMGLQGYSFSGVHGNQKLMVSNNGDHLNGYEEKPVGLHVETPLMEYGLEEIKQLISTNVCNNFNFFADDNKIEEKIMYC